MDDATTVGGEHALGKNLLVAYIPWERYNVKHAVLISECLIYEDIEIDFHIWKYEIETYVWQATNLKESPTKYHI